MPAPAHPVDRTDHMGHCPNAWSRIAQILLVLIGSGLDGGAGAKSTAQTPRSRSETWGRMTARQTCYRFRPSLPTTGFLFRP